MAELKVDKKTLIDLFSNKNAYFLIPDYQRPYAWDETHCETLWNDLKEFTLPQNNPDKFKEKENDEYFLGPIVTCNNTGKKEVIDGQQRITTLLLLLRAFYEKFREDRHEESEVIKSGIEKSIWKTNEYGKAYFDQLKIESQVATDEEKNELIEILKTGNVSDNQKSRYAQNYDYFNRKINELSLSNPTYIRSFAIRVLNNCILLPIEAESQDTALRIFSTLNDRGLPLSDSDLFKAQLYKYFGEIGEKDYFIEAWKDLEKICHHTTILISQKSKSPTDDLFYNFMYYDRAMKNNRDTTLESLRKYYEKDNYRLLRSKENFEKIRNLAQFWKDIQNQNNDRFSEEILKRLFVLNYAPNNMWTYFVSVYYMSQKDEQDKLLENKFCDFLDKLTIFTIAYHITRPGTTALRTPYFSEMANLLKGQPVTFDDYKFNAKFLKDELNNYSFNYIKPITKSVLAWWIFQNPSQELPPLSEIFDTEHIYSRNKMKIENPNMSERRLESIGNKSLLERSINIRASDYRFYDKKKYYQGKRNTKSKIFKPTIIKELLELSQNKKDFTEIDIMDREAAILNAFMNELEKQGMLQQFQELTGEG